MLGRVQIFLKAVMNEVGIFKATHRPSEQTTGEVPTFMVLLQWFISTPERFKFKYKDTNSFWIDVEAIISAVTVSRDPLT